MDPFGRTSYGAMRPLEASWRSVVGYAGSRPGPGSPDYRQPAADIASTMTLKPPPAPSDVPAPVDEDSSPPRRQRSAPPGQHRPHNVVIGMGVHGGRMSYGRQLTHEGGYVSSLWGLNLHIVLVLQGFIVTWLTCTLRSSPDSLMPLCSCCSPGWGASSQRLIEVPEDFWRTVAPDVHHEIAEYLFDQDYDQSR